MSKRSFIAHSWLRQDIKSVESNEGLLTHEGKSYRGETALSHRDELPDELYCELPPIPKAFRPSQFLVPGWSGHSLFSKQAVALKKLQENLSMNALGQLLAADHLPKSYIKAIHNEFLNTVKGLKSISDAHLDELLIQDAQSFWLETKKEDSKFKDVIEYFLKLYSFRVGTLFLFKLKFLITYAKSCQFDFSASHIANPSTFVNVLFKKGSSYQISCESLKANHYSWYRPPQALAQEIMSISKNFSGISITQLMKLACFRDFQNRKNNNLSFHDADYSHALSHKTFGKFINQLLVFFPLWKKMEHFSYPIKSRTNNPDIINTKFVGDHIESFSQGHWLAQEDNMDMEWSEILCPVFHHQNAGTEKFFNICQELQFLTFLVSYSKGKNVSTRELIRRVTKEKYAHASAQSQMNFFANREEKTLKHSRVVLNLSHLPKKNPHHYLIGKVQDQLECLSDHGQLVVLTNQKFFVPSQSKKVDAVLKNFKVDAIFNFEKLQGRGEICNHIYILRKRPQSRPNSTQQESCKTFYLSGELSLFSHFDVFLEELYEFFIKKSSYSTSVYQKSLNYSLNFEYHQDAIIEGKLLSSMNNGDSKITHPHFFKNLTTNCLPFEKFFQFEEISNTKKSNNNITSSLLGIRSDLNSSHYVLIVDYRDPLQVQLEITNSDSYLAKKEEYGNAYFQYYKLLPKIKHINLNLLREYFSSELGRQVTQIGLSGGPGKMRGKLRSLLIPSFFGQGQDLEMLDLENYLFLTIDQKELFCLHPKELQSKYQSEMSKLAKLKSENLWLYLSLLGHFKLLLKGSLDQINSGRSQEYNFTNPLFIDDLIKLDTYTIYPNEEIYTELLIEQKSDLEKALTDKELKLAKDDQDSCLEVYHTQDCLIRFHGAKEALLFIDFILSQAKGVSILKVLQSLKIPKTSELINVFNKFEQIDSTFSELYNNLESEIKYSITQKIAHN